MTQHFTRLTVSAEFYCGKCRKNTQHRIDHGATGAGRKGPCLDCIDKLNSQHEARIAKAEYQLQRDLFA